MLLAHWKPYSLLDLDMAKPLRYRKSTSMSNGLSQARTAMSALHHLEKYLREPEAMGMAGQRRLNHKKKSRTRPGVSMESDDHTRSDTWHGGYPELLEIRAFDIYQIPVMAGKLFVLVNDARIRSKAGRGYP